MFVFEKWGKKVIFFVNENGMMIYFNEKFVSEVFIII